MRTIKLTLAYDGTNYAGWQAQPNAKTLQGTLEAAIERVTGEAVRVLASGRTDAGVHALGQVVSFSTSSDMPGDVLQRAITNNLPRDMVVLEVVDAPQGFNALRDTVRKRYRYQLDDGQTPNPLDRHQVWHYGRPLDVEAMQQAANFFICNHDFASFQSSGSPRESTDRTIFRLTVNRVAAQSHLIAIDVEADGFLYNMVRAIVGTLIEVGLGNQEPEWILDVINAKDRSRAGRTAPAHGLCLMRVDYSFDGPLHDVRGIKRGEQVLAAIEQYYAESTERPKFCFHDVQCMEHVLFMLECIREFIIDDSEQNIGGSTGFNNFMTARGYGSLGYFYGKIDDEDDQPVVRPPLTGPSDEELKKMAEFGAFWREYLASSQRLRFKQP